MGRECHKLPQCIGSWQERTHQRILVNFFYRENAFRSWQFAEFYCSSPSFFSFAQHKAEFMN